MKLITQLQTIFLAKAHIFSGEFCSFGFSSVNFNVFGFSTLYLV